MDSPVSMGLQSHPLPATENSQFLPKDHGSKKRLVWLYRQQEVEMHSFSR